MCCVDAIVVDDDGVVVDVDDDGAVVVVAIDAVTPVVPAAVAAAVPAAVAAAVLADHRSCCRRCSFFVIFVEFFVFRLALTTAAFCVARTIPTKTQRPCSFRSSHLRILNLK